MIIGEKAPTIVPPEDYKKRFRISMDSYFVTVLFGGSHKNNLMSIENLPFPRNLNSLRACKLCKLIKNRNDVKLSNSRS